MAKEISFYLVIGECVLRIKQKQKNLNNKELLKPFFGGTVGDWEK